MSLHTRDDKLGRGTDDMSLDRAAGWTIPRWMQGLLVLRRSLDRRRLRLAWQLGRESGLRVLFTQIRLHISFRYRLMGSDRNDDNANPVVLYSERAWPEGCPLVSVVIPCFNYGHFVEEAIDSVVAQTFTDLEIIVVEGGSTDGKTRRVLEGLHRPKMTVLFRDEPHRVGDNRNFGIRHARGKYICCLDADDILMPTYIEKAVFLLEQYGYDVSSTSMRRFGTSEEIYGVLPTPELSDMIKGNHVMTCAVFRRSLWEQAGGYEDVPEGAIYLYEDWRFWIRLSCLGARITNIVGEQLFLYRAHQSGSISNADGVLPNDVQGQLICQAEQALITPQALERSHSRAVQRMRSTTALDNLRRASNGVRSTQTILLAMPFMILGGAERLLSEVVRHLSDLGYRIVIITTLYTLPEHGDTTSWFEPATAEIYHLPRFLTNSQWQDFVTYTIETKHVDLLWIVGSAFFYDALPQLKEYYPALMVIDLLFNSIGHSANNRRYSDHIDLNLVENEDVRSWLLANGESPERIRAIPSGVDLQRYKPVERSEAVIKALDLDQASFIVGFSGRLSEEKGPLSFLRISRQFADEPSVRFVMTGAGPLEGDVRQTIARQKLDDRVHFVGMVPDVREYLACYDVLIVPSEIDGRPTVVLEALAMGIPVIASAIGGLPELIQHGETGFLCGPNDISGFARCIAELRDDVGLRARMRKSAREFAESHLGIERMTAGYADAFHDLLQSASYPSPAESCGAAKE